MTLLGSPFSPAFAEVILAVDSIIIAIALLVVFSACIAASWPKIVRSACALARYFAHPGPRHG